MKLTVQHLKDIHSNQLFLEFSPEDITKIWKLEQKYTNDVAKWNAYLNHLCLQTFVRWLEDEEYISEMPLTFPNATSLSNIWEFVNGTAITIGNTKMVLIPSEIIDTEEFSIPGEWVDIPEWKADYYLAVQVDLEENWMRIWGYASHRTVKQQGNYNDFQRVYVLQPEYLVEDIDLIWVANQLNLSQQVSVKPLPQLSISIMQELIKKLNQPASYSPRLDLDVSFPEWCSLIKNDDYREELYQQRLVNSGLVVVSNAQANQFNPRRINLNNWLIRDFGETISQGWYDVKYFLSLNSQFPKLAFRSRRTVNKEEIVQAKLINLGVELGDKSVILLIALTPKDDDLVQVIAQVHPTRNDKYLPHALKLKLLTELGESLDEVESRIKDNYIQTNYFDIVSDTNFSIQVSLGNITFTEDFGI